MPAGSFSISRFILRGGRRRIANCCKFFAEKTDLGKSDIKANEIGNAVGKRVEEMAGWIKEHAKKLGIKEKEPEHSDF
ncbi:MAG: hypothetical protein H6559_23550 [Lewinellaceae bacterium]|nr:hypothetical protein [Lewinellaceae bacterium]